ncbi:Transcription elongation factor B polypeptide [Dorcoceras hygrometricum]|uniref:Elongin-C n=1 Tax=Dorcoceras hygrometricum TaxID=472368 RepID=A0A2Z7AYH6_9LAMI|nr:Transcription elongation factor B polypeptide [Dorcoceras hygrometricum]
MTKEDMVKLISAEGFEFVIDKKAAMVSQTIRNMLTSPGSFAETEHGEVTFPEISTTVLEKICRYFYWSLQYARFFLVIPTIIYCTVDFKEKSSEQLLFLSCSD